jgi:hypothetical protein
LNCGCMARIQGYVFHGGPRRPPRRSERTLPTDDPLRFGRRFAGGAGGLREAPRRGGGLQGGLWVETPLARVSHSNCGKACLPPQTDVPRSGATVPPSPEVELADRVDGGGARWQKKYNGSESNSRLPNVGPDASRTSTTSNLSTITAIVGNRIAGGIEFCRAAGLGTPPMEPATRRD